jgi:hypothetical protein
VRNKRLALITCYARNGSNTNGELPYVFTWSNVPGYNQLNYASVRVPTLKVMLRFARLKNKGFQLDDIDVKS